MDTLTLAGVLGPSLVWTHPPCSRTLTTRAAISCVLVCKCLQKPLPLAHKHRQFTHKEPTVLFIPAMLYLDVNNRALFGLTPWPSIMILPLILCPVCPGHPVYLLRLRNLADVMLEHLGRHYRYIHDWRVKECCQLRYNGCLRFPWNHEVWMP